MPEVRIPLSPPALDVARLLLCREQIGFKVHPETRELIVCCHQYQEAQTALAKYFEAIEEAKFEFMKAEPPT